MKTTIDLTQFNFNSRIFNQISDCPNPGDLFFNTTDNKHYGFDGTSWNALY